MKRCIRIVCLCPPVLTAFLPGYGQVALNQILPSAAEIYVQDGLSILPKAVTLYAEDPESKQAAQLIQHYVEKVSYWGASLVTDKQIAYIHLKKAIIPDTNTEAYQVYIHNMKIEIVASTQAGLTNGALTVSQLLLKSMLTNQGIQCGQISDAPKFKWRGMHLDVSRHFFTVEFIKKYLDMLALSKINVFHWHLTDDNGWRIEIKKYPKLTEVGAFRSDNRHRDWNYFNYALENTDVPYGGYYTQEQIKDIVRYAKARNIDVVPEIDLPGHSAAALHAYNWLSCENQSWTKDPKTPFEFSDPLCVCKPEVIAFSKDVLTEIIDLFPSPYIHIGGDECKHSDWLNFAPCQDLMTKNNIKTTAQLQSWYNAQLEQHIISKGKKMIGWDEIMEGGISATTAVMIWRGELAEAHAQMAENHKTNFVMVPSTYLYFDKSQIDGEFKNIWLRELLNLEKVYAFETPNSTYNMGMQACLWTENVQTPTMAEYRTFPRLFALSEMAWSKQTKKDFPALVQKVESLYPILDKLGYAYYLPGLQPIPAKNVIIGATKVALDKEYPTGTIYYTLDGSEPTLASKAYAGPIEINSTTTLKAAVYYTATSKSNILTATYEMQTPKPATALQKPIPGLKYVYSETSINSISEGWSTLKPKSKGVISSITIPGFVRKDHWAMQFDGYLYIPKTGVYTFILSSDDGSILYLDGQEILNYDGVHGADGRLTSLALEKGFHAFQLKYFESLYGETLKLYWKDDSGNEVLIPANAFFYTK